MSLLKDLRRVIFGPSLSEQCSFCGGRSADLRLLITGKHASICEPCTLTTIGAIAGETRQAEPAPARATASAALDAVLSAVNRATPPEDRDLIVRAATLLAAEEINALDRVYRHVIRLADLRTARDIVRAALAIALRGGDAASVTGIRLELATASARLGDLDTAREQLAALEGATHDAVRRAEVALLRINLRVRWAEPSIDAVERKETNATLDAIDASLRMVPEGDSRAASVRVLRDAVVTARALVALRAGDGEMVVAMLREDLDGDFGVRHLALGDALWSLGKRAEAREVWELAKAGYTPLVPELAGVVARLGRTGP